MPQPWFLPGPYAAPDRQHVDARVEALADKLWPAVRDAEGTWALKEAALIELVAMLATRHRPEVDQESEALTDDAWRAAVGRMVNPYMRTLTLRFWRRAGEIAARLTADRLKDLSEGERE